MIDSAAKGELKGDPPQYVPRSPKYISNLCGLLQVFFEIARQNDLITTSPYRPKIHRPVLRKKAKPTLERDQVLKVIMRVEPIYRPIFLLDALSLFRAGELLAFRWKNFDQERGTLQATHSLFSGGLKWLSEDDRARQSSERRLIEGVKTEGSEKPVKLSKFLVLMLSDHRDASQWKGDDDLIFCRSDGSPYEPNFLRKKVLYPALDQEGIPRASRTHGFHMLRHTGATILAEVTRDPILVRDILRHTRLSTTAGYINLEVGAEASETLTEMIVGKEERVN